MSKLKEWLEEKITKKAPQATAKDFYLMLSYYDIKSPNIAVIGNMAKYKWVVNNQIKQMRRNKNVEDKVLKVSDNKYIFLQNGIESTFMHIEDIHEDLEANKIKYRKYM